MHVFDRLYEFWTPNTPLPPEAPERITEVFEQLGYSPTEDALRLYATIGGVENAPGMFSLWSLDEILQQNRDARRTSSWPERRLLFADFLLRSNDFWLEHDNLLSSVHWVEGQDDAPSLAEFFEIYLSDPDSLVNW